jgi:hypothetical protein
MRWLTDERTIQYERSEAMHSRRLVTGGILVVGLIAVTWLGTGPTPTAVAGGDHRPPSDGQVAFAQRTSDLLLATLFAALTQEFNETTPDNVEEGKRSISLVFNDRNKDMRLVGTFGPLRENDRPRDAFERAALQRALNGQPYTAVERDDGVWSYRRSVPLSNFRMECALCHTNFPPGPTPDWVGALMLRVPIE